jgi:hypothetical protein
MSNIVQKKKLPQAIAKEKDGIVMYWVEELGEGGLHLKGLARLLDYNAGSLSALLKGVEQITILEARIVTESGVKTVELYTGQSIAKILRHISRSRASQAVRERADDIRDNLAAAGFKLAVMLELAPQQLAAQVQQHIDKEIRLQELKLETAKLVGDLTTLHGKELAMTAIGAADQIVRVETVVTEVVNPATGRSDKILSSDQLKRVVADRTGQTLKTMKLFTDKLKADGRDDLLIPVTRHSTTEYVDPSKLDEAIDVVYAKERQTLITPSLLARHQHD